MWNSLVVVDVQLGVGVGGTSSLESDADKVLTEDTVEDAVAQGTVLVEDLVDNVPGVDLALVAAHHVGDVVLENLGQGVAVVDVLDPLGKLGVPDWRREERERVRVRPSHFGSLGLI